MLNLLRTKRTFQKILFLAIIFAFLPSAFAISDEDRREIDRWVKVSELETHWRPRSEEEFEHVLTDVLQFVRSRSFSDQKEGGYVRSAIRTILILHRTRNMFLDFYPSQITAKQMPIPVTKVKRFFQEGIGDIIQGKIRFRIDTNMPASGAFDIFLETGEIVYARVWPDVAVVIHELVHYFQAKSGPLFFLQSGIWPWEWEVEAYFFEFFITALIRLQDPMPHESDGIVEEPEDSTRLSLNARRELIGQMGSQNLQTKMSVLSGYITSSLKLLDSEMQAGRRASEAERLFIRLLKEKDFRPSSWFELQRSIATYVYLAYSVGHLRSYLSTQLLGREAREEFVELASQGPEQYRRALREIIPATLEEAAAIHQQEADEAGLPANLPMVYQTFPLEIFLAEKLIPILELIPDLNFDQLADRVDSFIPELQSYLKSVVSRIDTIAPPRTGRKRAPDPSPRNVSNRSCGATFVGLPLKTLR